MKKAVLFMLLLLIAISSVHAEVILTGIMFTRVWRESSSNPGTWSAVKVPVIELYVDGTYDFDIDGALPLERCLNGGGWYNVGTALPASGAPVAYTDTFFYVYGTSSSYNDVWGEFGGIYENKSTREASLNSIDGNDGFRVGGQQVYFNIPDPNDESYTVYQNSWMYRKNGTGPEGLTWNPNNWIFGGNDVLLVDRPETENYMYFDELHDAVPFGTYVRNQCPCTADLVSEPFGTVDMADFDFFSDYWLNNDCNQIDNSCCFGSDLDEDGDVDVDDLEILSQSWLE